MLAEGALRTNHLRSAACGSYSTGNVYIGFTVALMDVIEPMPQCLFSVFVGEKDTLLLSVVESMYSFGLNWKSTVLLPKGIVMYPY
jgi:hypothetical protein